MEVLKQVDIIDDIIVNTDSELAIEIAKECDVNWYIREPYYASSECTNTEHWENLAETTDTDYIMHTPCTAPLVKVETYYDFINRFNNCLDLGHDSYNSVSKVKEYLWYIGQASLLPALFVLFLTITTSGTAPRP